MSRNFSDGILFAEPKDGNDQKQAKKPKAECQSLVKAGKRFWKKFQIKSPNGKQVFKDPLLPFPFLESAHGRASLLVRMRATAVIVLPIHFQNPAVPELAARENQRSQGNRQRVPCLGLGMDPTGLVHGEDEYR